MNILFLLSAVMCGSSLAMEKSEMSEYQQQKLALLSKKNKLLKRQTIANEALVAIKVFDHLQSLTGPKLNYVSQENIDLLESRIKVFKNQQK